MPRRVIQNHNYRAVVRPLREVVEKPLENPRVIVGHNQGLKVSGARIDRAHHVFPNMISPVKAHRGTAPARPRSARRSVVIYARFIVKPDLPTPEFPGELLLERRNRRFVPVNGKRPGANPTVPHPAEMIVNRIFAQAYPEYFFLIAR